MLDHDIARWVQGRPADPTALWQPLWEWLHEAGGGGVTTIAMAGLDTALWDLSARRAGLSLPAHLGARRDSVPAYGSGINLYDDLDVLLAQARRWVDDGFEAVKIKVGSPDLDRDLSRVAAVREVIGSTRLMIDANQRWDLDTATTALARLEAFDPVWIEEPLRADDLQGYVALSERTGIPIACGENLYTRHRFAEFARSGAVAFLQPNIIRIGGITPLAGVVDACDAHGVEVALHLLPELSGQLALTLPAETAAEIIDGARLDDLDILAAPSPVEIAGGRLRALPHDGIGIHFRTPPLEESA